MLEFIEHLNLGPFILFGHSLGGAIAISLADKCRDRLHQIILSESNLDKSSEGSTSKYIADFEMEDFINYGFSKLINDSRKDGNGMGGISVVVTS